MFLHENRRRLVLECRIYCYILHSVYKESGVLPLKKLTEKQKLFCDEYLIDLNITRAYKTAYASCKSDEAAASNGNRLIRNDKVKEYIAERIKEREERTEITQDQVVKELAKIAFANITDFVDIVEETKDINKIDEFGCFYEEQVKVKEVDIKATKDIPQDKIGVIASIKQGANGIEIKTNDKVKALELLGKHLGMFKDNIDVSIKDSKKLKDVFEQIGGEGLDE